MNRVVSYGLPIEIEWLERIFALPDTRPLWAKVTSRQPIGTRGISGTAHGFGAASAQSAVRQG